MVSVTKSNNTPLVIWGIVVGLFFLAYSAFFRTLMQTWLNDPEFSFGILIPVIVAYLIWNRRGRWKPEEKAFWPAGLAMVLAGCGLQVLGSLGGTLILSGIAFVLTAMGTIAFLWGRGCLHIVATPLALLILMVPLPSYAVGELSWHLQSTASTVSGVTLGFLGVPIYQDGNLLRLPNYVLEVKQACSGSRSIFALLAMAFVLGLSIERRWWIRILLVVAAPVLALSANVIRIVGTGLIASHWGQLAANESLHEAWGIFVFLFAVLGLLGFQRLLRWATNEYA